MITRFFNGKYISNFIINNISLEAKLYNKLLNKSLCISIILIGNNFSTNLYVKNKIETSFLTNIGFLIFKFSKSIKLNTLIKILLIINFDFFITGIIIQIPISKTISKQALFPYVNRFKDIDLLNFFNFGEYAFCDKKNIVPSTAMSVLCLIKKFKSYLFGKKCCIFGFSTIVGKPIVFELNSLGMTVSIISSFDFNYLRILNESDIIISAVGKSNFLDSFLIPKGALVIDIGINENMYKLFSGDIFNKGYVGIITPVPGGIGPLTVSNIFFNLLRLNINKKNLSVI